MKSQNNRIQYLDGWRGIAILFVLLSHFFTNDFMDMGRLGVDVFFVLSGLLMGKILFIKKTNLRIFYIRRFSRVYPVFFIYVISIYFIYWLYNDSTPLVHIIPTLFFLRTYLPSEIGIYQASIPIGHLWSLNVEEHAYIIMSFLTLIFVKSIRSAYSLISLAFVSQLIFLMYVYNIMPEPNDPEIRTETVVTYIFYSAGYRLLLENYPLKVPEYMPILAFFAAIVCYLNLTPWWCNFFPPILLAFTVNHLGTTYKTVQKMLSFVVLQRLGMYSFSIYLWQQPFYKLQEYFIPGMSLFFAIIVGIMSFYLIENPVRYWINKRWG